MIYNCALVSLLLCINTQHQFILLYTPLSCCIRQNTVPHSAQHWNPFTTFKPNVLNHPNLPTIYNFPCQPQPRIQFVHQPQMSSSCPVYVSTLLATITKCKKLTTEPCGTPLVTTFLSQKIPINYYPLIDIPEPICHIPIDAMGFNIKGYKNILWFLLAWQCNCLELSFQQTPINNYTRVLHNV